MAASPAIVEERPSETGRHFPNDCSDGNWKFERFPATFPLRAIYLPTRECLKAAEARFGARARPLLMAWREIWRAAVGDVDAYARAVGAPPLGTERPEEGPQYPGCDGPDFVRPSSYHVMEDADALVGALAEGTPFALRIRGAKVRHDFVPVPGLRRIARYADVRAPEPGRGPSPPTTSTGTSEGRRPAGGSGPSGSGPGAAWPWRGARGRCWTSWRTCRRKGTRRPS